MLDVALEVAGEAAYDAVFVVSGVRLASLLSGMRR